MLEDFRNIIDKHRLIGDSALLLLFIGLAFFVQPAYWGLQPPHLNALVTMTSALFAVIPLTWRRFFLTTALIFIAVTLVVPGVLNTISRVNLSSVASIIVVFSKAAYGGRKRNLICFASIVAFNGGLAYKLIISGNTGFLSSATIFNLIGLCWNLLTFFAIWWFGNTMRVSRERTSPLSTSKRQVIRENHKNVRWEIFGELGHITQRLYSILDYHIRVMAIHVRITYRILKQYCKKAPDSLKRIGQSVRYRITEVYRIFRPLWNEKQLDPNAARSGFQQLEKLATDLETSGGAVEN